MLQNEIKTNPHAEVAEIQAAYTIAIQMPRNIEQARIDLLQTCKRKRFAMAAMYSIPYGGKPVTGLSIRFAEEAIRLWGNIRTGVKTVYEDENQEKLMVVVTDLQTNVGYGYEITVRKEKEVRNLKKGETAISERLNSFGNKVYLVPASADDVRKERGAEISKKIRDGALRLLPADIKEEAEDTIIETQHGTVAENIHVERRKVLDGFSKIGISPSELQKYLGQAVETLSTMQIVELRQLYTAIKSGATTWKDVASVSEKAEDITQKTGKRTEEMKNKLNGLKNKVEKQLQPGEKAEKLWKALEEICGGDMETTCAELHSRVGTSKLVEVTEEMADRVMDKVLAELENERNKQG